MQYKYGEDGGRRTPIGPFSQKLPRRVLKHLLPQTVDIDIENCMFTIVSQLLDRLGPVVHPPPTAARHSAFGFPCFRRCASDRSGCLAEIGEGMSPVQKKALNIAIANGKVVPSEFEDKGYLCSLSAEARVLRWMSSWLQKDIYHESKAKRQWPEAYMFYLLWTMVEDDLLHAMTEFLDPSACQHLSLHFDGLRVDKGRVEALGGEGSLLKQLEDAVKAATGYTVKLAVKEHFFAFQN